MFLKDFPVTLQKNTEVMSIRCYHNTSCRLLPYHISASNSIKIPSPVHYYNQFKPLVLSACLLYPLKRVFLREYKLGTPLRLHPMHFSQYLFFKPFVGLAVRNRKSSDSFRLFFFSRCVKRDLLYFLNFCK